MPQPGYAFAEGCAADGGSLPVRFDLVDLRLFLHVAEAGSITAGAERAGLALASASARVRGMEEALGAALLERGRRGVGLTPAGHSVAHHARAVLAQVERMRGDLAEHARGLRGRVRLLSNTAALSEALPDALAPWLAANPGVDLDLQERPSGEVVRAVREGAADAGIAADWLDLSGLQTFAFRDDRLVLVVARGHALAGRRRVAFRDVLDEGFVGLSEGSALQRHLGWQAAQAGRALKLRVRVQGVDAVCRLVGCGVGAGVVPETAARRCRRVAGIAAVRLTDPWTLRRLTLCVRRLDALPVHARRLVEHLAAGGRG